MVEDTEDVINCEAMREEDTGLYRMIDSLKKYIDYMPASSYSFILKVQVSEPVYTTKYR